MKAKPIKFWGFTFPVWSMDLKVEVGILKNVSNAKLVTELEKEIWVTELSGITQLKPYL